MLFCAPFRESCPLFRLNPTMAEAPNSYCHWSARSYLMTTGRRGNRSSAGSLCMVGSFGQLGMMGRQLVGRCMVGTYAHARAGERSRACRSLDKQVWGTGYSAYPCALLARWAVSDETGTSTKRFRLNLAAKSSVCCPLGCADWKGGKSHSTVGCVVSSQGAEVLLSQGRESESGCLYRNALCRRVLLV